MYLMAVVVSEHDKVAYQCRGQFSQLKQQTIAADLPELPNHLFHSSVFHYTKCHFKSTYSVDLIS